MKLYKLLIPIFALISLTIITSCQSMKKTPATTSIYWINSLFVDCEGVAPMKCLQVKKSENGTWENFYSKIEGFEFVVGYQYKIEVKEETKDPKMVPADGSSIVYTLVKVIEKQFDNKQNINDIWILEKIGETDFSKASSKRNRRPQLEINLKEMKIFGNDGCNNYSGSITSFDTDELSFGPILSTRMACPDMTTTYEFHKVMEQVQSYKLKGLKLYLLDSNGIVLLKFQKID